MTCKNCGLELEAGAAFCANCGAKVEEVQEVKEVQATEEVQVAEEPEVVIPTPESMEQPEVTKKKRKFPKVLVTILAIVVILGGAGLIFKDAIIGKVAFLLPAETQLKVAYKDAAKKWAEDASELVTDVNEVEVSTNNAVSGKLALSIGESAKKELEEAAAVDLGDVNEVSMNYEYGYKDNQMLMNCDFTVGQTKILTANTTWDFETGKLAIAVPELSKTAIEFDMEDDLGIDAEEFSSAMEQSEDTMKEVKGMLPSKELLEDMIPRYISVVVQTIDEVEREKDVIEVGDVSQKAKALTVELDERMVKNIGDAIKDELKEDEAFEKYLKKVVKEVYKLQGDELSNSDWNDMYDELLDGVEELFDAATEEDAIQDGVEIVTWVNSKNEIIGIEIADSVEWLSIKDGKQVAKRLLIKEDKDEVAKILVEGTEEKDVFAGDVKIYSYKEEVISFKVSKYSYIDNKLDLATSVDITEEMFEELTGESNPYGDAKIQLELTSSKESASIVLKVIVGGKEWLVVDSTAKNISDKVKVTYPKDVMDGYDDMDEWLETVDVSSVVDNLDKAGLLDIFGVEDKDEFKQSLQALKDGLGGYSYDDYDYDYDDYYDDYDDYDDYYDDDYFSYY